MQYLNIFLTFVNSNVKSVKMFGHIKKLYYFCGVKLYMYAKCIFFNLTPIFSTIIIFIYIKSKYYDKVIY